MLTKFRLDEYTEFLKVLGYTATGFVRAELTAVKAG